MSFNRKIRRNMMKNNNSQQIDYKLHLAQQIEILNQNIELLKNNIYGRSQVELVIYALSEGHSNEEAINFSLDVIDEMNRVNHERLEMKRKEHERLVAEQKAKEESRAAEEESQATNDDSNKEEKMVENNVA